MHVAPDGKPAATRYETLRRDPGLADLRLCPETGRTHQIRVHLAAKGHPIAGDDFYGGATRWRGVRNASLRAALQRLTHTLLHAERIVVETMALDIRAPLPADFEEILEILRGSGRARRGCEPGGASAHASVAPHATR